MEAQHIKEDVQGLSGASTDELMTLPAVLGHQLVRDSKREQALAERRVAELAKRYGPKHPQMISARADLEVASENLAREVRKVVTGINHEYAVALRNEQELQESWEARKSEMQEFNRTEFELQELQRDVEANRQLYDIFFTRVRSVSETGGFEKPHARIVDRAVVPKSPVKPNKRLTVLVALALGTVLGCIAAILLDVLDNTVKTPDDVAEKLQAALLGTVPLQGLDKSGGFEQIWENQQSQFAEAIRTIRTGVILSSLDQPAKVIVVTSTVPGEGKSTMALNLGSALGQMEKTLVIGGDLRRPSLAKKCGLEPNHQGLSHFVSGTAALEDCIEYLEDKQFHVMPAGVIPPNPLEMISSARFLEALSELRQRFDRIVIDSAPLQAVSDALVLCSHADSVVYVVRADSTSATQAQKSIASIVGSNEPLTGIVLNMFDARRAASYYGGSGYYAHYKYDQDSA
jgi:capsular exopolysaccharide synthesis family protein